MKRQDSTSAYRSILHFFKSVPRNSQGSSPGIAPFLPQAPTGSCKLRLTINPQQTTALTMARRRPTPLAQPTRPPRKLPQLDRLYH